MTWGFENRIGHVRYTEQTRQHLQRRQRAYPRFIISQLIFFSLVNYTQFFSVFICAVRLCELRSRTLSCEDLWHRDVGNDKVGKNSRWPISLLSFFHSFILHVLFIPTWSVRHFTRTLSDEQSSVDIVVEDILHVESYVI